MSCEHDFGIIETLDTEKNYADLPSDCEFSDILKTYHCASIDDDAFNDWWPYMQDMAVYWHTYSRPEKALERYSVTLVPPESLNQLYSVVKDHTPPEFAKQAEAVLAVIDKARRNGKFVIHFGV